MLVAGGEEACRWGLRAMGAALLGLHFTSSRERVGPFAGGSVGRKAQMFENALRGEGTRRSPAAWGMLSRGPLYRVSLLGPACSNCLRHETVASWFVVSCPLGRSR